MPTAPNTLHTPLAAGRLRLPNRVLMAPMTRSRADDDGLVGPLTAACCAQRAGAGLVLSEAIFPEPMGRGCVRTPGLADDHQAAAWRSVTDAVRPAGAPYTDEGMKPHVTPPALTTAEIAGIAEAPRVAARRAILAGFGGVELHAGGGYLPMQFLSTGSNRRSDRYGGSALNRARFTLEVLEAMVGAVGADRTGLRLTRGMVFNDITDADLPQRFALGAPLNPADRDTFYAGGARGYVDYPALADEVSA